MEERSASSVSIMNWELFLDAGKKDFCRKYNSNDVGKKYRRSDFTLIRTIGEGTFSRVYLSRIVDDPKYYAVKILDKMKVIKLGEAQHIINEKKILQSINFPFCVFLKASFQDNSYLYLSLPFIPGGEMFQHLHRLKRFDEELSKFYGAQIVLAIEYLHHCNVIYRDLKPENIVIDADGYLKLTDFGFSKRIENRTYTVCGTPDYLAPELLVRKGYGKSVDWWTYGVLLYEMTSGRSPFQAPNMMKICQNILCCKYPMPQFFTSDLRHLVNNLLQPDITKRYGCRKEGIKDIKEHSWFFDVSWLNIFNRQVKAPFVPKVKCEGDSSNFDNFKEIRIEVAVKDYFSKDFEDF
ncbi:cAMP-dependent protein kinase catalytic subunit alpha [Halyomorpha halys]|uniref:cAMP-dependent protein kinase catalytic subunit alpha n=1 Tax=Halyomorpha halys TaxID=286706 RepID=UPI0006D515FA|nr:cAMP-dependent protein kinase catalytic subunit alpha-like [Halyomorpha halys]KAE8573610.1 hypothetical protein A483_HHAL012066 [Halyomorpha halys]